MFEDTILDPTQIEKKRCRSKNPKGIKKANRFEAPFKLDTKMDIEVEDMVDIDSDSSSQLSDFFYAT